MGIVAGERRGGKGGRSIDLTCWGLNDMDYSGIR